MLTLVKRHIVLGWKILFKNIFLLSLGGAQIAGFEIECFNFERVQPYSIIASSILNKLLQLRYSLVVTIFREVTLVSYP